MKLVPLAALAVALLSACSDQATPTATGSTASADRTASTCTTRADVVVHNEASLVSALASAHPGIVIGIAGYFQVGSDLNITTPSVTLTCATPGAGVAALPGVGNLIYAAAPGIVIDRLVLDGRLANQPFWTANDGITVFAASVRFTNNRVYCSPDNSCAVVLGGNGDVISDNYFEGAGSFDGIHIQSGSPNEPALPVDGAIITRNVIVATTPSTGRRQGAIRVYDGSNLLIAGNTIRGPWQNGISPARINASRIENNDISGPLSYGIAFSWVGAGNLLPPATGNVVRYNRIEKAGLAGIWAFLACGNTFASNDLDGNGGGIGILFPDSSGANTVLGSTRGYAVVNNGAFDCNGDGVIDPNIISVRSSSSSAASVTGAPSLIASDAKLPTNSGQAIRTRGRILQ